MKKVFIFALAMMFVVLFGCDKEKTEETDIDVVDSDTVADDTDDTETPDEDSDNPPDCTLDSEWMEPEEGWASWAYLKMMGPIADYDGDFQAAVFTDGKMKVTSGTTEFADGGFMNYQSSTLLAMLTTYEFTDVDEVAGTAVVDYWDSIYQFSQQLVPVLKEEKVREAGFGASTFLRHTYIDVTYDTGTGAVTSDQTRKGCFVAISKTEEYIEDGKTYNIPVGDMYGCFDDNVDGSVGEDLKMMFKNELLDDAASILKDLNTQSDGSVLEYGEEGFMHVCSCFDEEGTEVPCWGYDGPGGAEECPDYVPEDECVVANDNDDVDDTDSDEVPDDDADGISSKMVPCDQTGVVAPDNAAIVVEDVEVTWTGENWTAPAKCVWACNTDYDKEGETCINSKTVDCLTITGKPANSHDVVTTHQITYTTAGGWTVAPVCAEWECDADYAEESEQCINSKMVNCDETEIENPANSHVLTGVQVEITYTTAGGWTSPAKCEWDCDANYDLDEGACIDSKLVDCAPNPEKPENTVDKITQVFIYYNDTDGWTSPAVCTEWECAPDTIDEGDGCIHTKMVACDPEGVVVPANATADTSEEVEITYTDADNWSAPAQCSGWVCDACYKLNSAEDGCEPQTVVYVDYAAMGDDTGYNWADAYTNLSTALENVCENQEVWVAQGTYVPTTCPRHGAGDTCDGNPEERHFFMKSNVTLYGGFSGTETLVTERDIENNTTIISGDMEEDDVWNDTTKTWDNLDDNVRYIFYLFQDDLTNMVIDGFSIQGSRDFGVFIAQDNNVLTLRNNYFTANRGAVRTRWNVDHTSVNTTLDIDSCVFEKNSGIDRGLKAVYVREGTLSITDTQFIDNYGDFGSILETNNTDTTITGSTFTGNTAEANNIYIEGGTIDVSGSTFSNNVADDNDPENNYSSGGVFGIRDADLTITDCTFDSNAADNGSVATIDASGKKLTITGSTFTANAAVSDGAIQSWNPLDVVIDSTSFSNHEGGRNTILGVASGSTIDIRNGSTFTNNTASEGGLMSFSGSIVTIDDTSFTSNSGKRGIAIEVREGSSLTITNSDFINNTGVDSGPLNVYDSDLVVENSTFSGNTCTLDPIPNTWNPEEPDYYSDGAAIQFNIDDEGEYTGTVSLANCTFSQNIAKQSPAVSIRGATDDVIVTDCQFTENDGAGTADNSDAVLNVRDLADGKKVVVTDCLFENNIAPGFDARGSNAEIANTDFIGNHAGSGAALTAAYIKIDGCRFIGNVADLISEEGEMVGFGGALMINGMEGGSGDPAVIKNSVFESNTAGITGGAIFAILYPVLIENCTFTNNSAGMMNSGLSFTGDMVGSPMPFPLASIINNSIVTDIIYQVTNEFAGQGFSFNPSDVTINFSDIIGSGGSGDWSHWATDGGSNIDENPMFVGTGDENLMLLSYSPCIDAGNDGLVTSSVDLLGNTRIVNGVDMGAYEFFAPCDADPCSGGTPVCIESGTPEGYACYPEYTVGWCNVQWPNPTATGTTGEKIDMYGRVYVAGITDVTEDLGDAHPLVRGQWGVSSTDSDPIVNPGDFSWDDATLNPSGGADWNNNDEYMYGAIPPAAGTYYYAYRFSADGGYTWTYCGTGGIWNNDNGVATVTDPE